ncbi:MAG: MarR family winged helix-turn-helix transcriptional regulator [Gammaproteobacteria bacterium]
MGNMKDDMGGIEADARMAVLQKLRVVMRAAQQHSNWIEKQCGVSGTQLWMMHELADAGVMRVGELAVRLAVQQSTASNLIEDLVKCGYASKHRDRDDQRVVNLKLTEAGKTLLASAPTPARGLVQEALTRLDPEGLARLNAGLQSLVDSIEGLDQSYAFLPLPFNM